MINTNQLKSLIDFYKQNVADPNRGLTGGGGFFDRGGEALDWATQFLNNKGSLQSSLMDSLPSEPNFFGGQPGQGGQGYGGYPQSAGYPPGQGSYNPTPPMNQNMLAGLVRRASYGR